MKRNKIVFLNSTFNGADHEIIDSSIIIAASFCFQQVEVRFLPIRSRLIQDCVEKYPVKGNATISFCPIKSYRFFRSFSLSNVLSSVQELWQYLLTSDSVFVCTVFSSFNYNLLNIFAKWLRKPIVFCCHNELEEIANCGRSELRHFFAQRLFLKQSLASDVKFILLSRSILHKLSTYIDAKRLNSFAVFPHPYFSRNAPSICRTTLNDNIVIGIVGFLSADYERGFDNVVEFSNMLAGCPQFSFRVISRVEDGLVDQLPANVQIVGAGKHLERDEYERHIDDCDYIYLPYPADAYAFTASGAVLQAISLHKPLLMNSTSFCKLLQDDYGPYGYFVDQFSPEQIPQILKNEIAYRDLVQNQMRISAALLPESSAQLFYDIVKDM